MAIIKSIPSKRIINGNAIITSEISVVSELDYRTNGEFCIVVRGISQSFITLNSATTDHIVVKAMTMSNLDSVEVIGISYHPTD